MSQEWLEMLQAAVHAAAMVCAKQSARARERGDINRELRWLERAGYWMEFHERVKQKLEKD